MNRERPGRSMIIIEFKPILWWTPFFFRGDWNFTSFWQFSCRFFFVFFFSVFEKNGWSTQNDRHPNSWRDSLQMMCRGKDELKSFRWRILAASPMFHVVKSRNYHHFGTWLGGMERFKNNITNDFFFVFVREGLETARNQTKYLNRAYKCQTSDVQSPIKKMKFWRAFKILPKQFLSTILQLFDS